jgi:acyl-CoA synthetase (NDP forming)
LRGFRGAKACDEEAVRDVLMRLSALIDLSPEIAELDLNPLIVSSEGAFVADVRIRVAPTQTTASRRIAY